MQTDRIDTRILGYFAEWAGAGGQVRTGSRVVGARHTAIQDTLTCISIIDDPPLCGGNTSPLVWEKYFR